MNIITTILEVRFLWGFLRNSCITGKTKLEKYQIYNLQADKQLRGVLFIVRAGGDIIKAEFMHTKKTNCLTKMKIGIHLEELK